MAFPRRAPVQARPQRARRKADVRRAGSPTPPPCRDSPTAWHRPAIAAARRVSATTHGRSSSPRCASCRRAAQRARAACSAARGQADFTEATLRALLALGTTDDPSDLLLAIDYRLSHLLIDEFQDTSRAQLALIGRLCEGWEPGDGRTLFAVGDPMQSIYRFRQAEVRLFIESQAQRQRRRRCRSASSSSRAISGRSGTIVGWVNDVFAHVLPRAPMPLAAKRRFRASVRRPFRPATTSRRRSISSRTRGEEAATVVARIREALAAGMASVAVLVRARSHAQPLLPALRAAGIDFSAVDLEGLHDRLATRDLLSLARALAQPADRLAWLAILRAPWCGLPLADLLVIANACGRSPAARRDRRSPPCGTRSRPTAACGSSGCGRRSSRRLPRAVASGSQSVCAPRGSRWAGPRASRSPLDRAGADRVFALLAEQERGGDLPDDERMNATGRAPVRSDRSNPSATTVQVMTLHRAKGLQFDAVILPGTRSRDGRRRGSRCCAGKSASTTVRRSLMLAPLRAKVGTHAAPDPVYEWLGTLDAAEEIGRARPTALRRRHARQATAAPDRRSRSCARTRREWKRPARGTPLERLWDALAAAPPPPSGDVGADDTHGESRRGGLAAARAAPAIGGCRRCRSRCPLPCRTLRPADAPVFDWADADRRRGRNRRASVACADCRGRSRALGRAPAAARARAHPGRTRAPRGSKPMCGRAPRSALPPSSPARSATRGAAGCSIARMATRAANGRWRARTRAGSCTSSSTAASSRTAVATSSTSRPARTSAAMPRHFLRQEFDRYRPQLDRYARIVRALDPRPVRIALYHPLVDGGWQEVDRLTHGMKHRRAQHVGKMTRLR